MLLCPPYLTLYLSHSTSAALSVFFFSFPNPKLFKPGNYDFRISTTHCLMFCVKLHINCRVKVKSDLLLVILDKWLNNFTAFFIGHNPPPSELNNNADRLHFNLNHFTFKTVVWSTTSFFYGTIII